jgi:glutaredoxin
VHEGQEERPERAPRGIVGLGGPPQREEAVVHHVLREDLLPGQAVGEAVGGGGVPAVELVERAAIPTRERPVQLQVVPSVVLHDLKFSQPETACDRGPVASPHMAAPTHVLLYSRPACGLCDRAREVLEVQRARTPFVLEEIDISESDDLEREFGLRIPVVVVDGRERFEVEVDPTELAALVAGPASG